MKGVHFLVDAEIKKALWPTSPDVLEGFLVRCAESGGAQLVGSRVVMLPRLLSYGMPPGGTAWVGFDESHITLHWYEVPETENINGLVRFALDVFTCGDRQRQLEIVDRILCGFGELTWSRTTTLNRFTDKRQMQQWHGKKP